MCAKLRMKVGLRHPRTTQEKRAAGSCREARRSANSLPDVYDDIWRYAQRSWKAQSKRMHQFRAKEG